MLARLYEKIFWFSSRTAASAVVKGNHKYSVCYDQYQIISIVARLMGLEECEEYKRQIEAKSEGEGDESERMSDAHLVMGGEEEEEADDFSSLAAAGRTASRRMSQLLGSSQSALLGIASGHGAGSDEHYLACDATEQRERFQDFVFEFNDSFYAHLPQRYLQCCAVAFQ